MRWRPVLSGRDARLAEQAIGEIGKSLVAPSTSQIPFEAQRPSSVGFGAAGTGLFFAYEYMFNGQHSSRRFARREIDRAIDGLASETMTPDLMEGFAGIAWCVEHLAKCIQIEPPSDAFEEIDDAIRLWLESAHVRWEFMLGIAGVCIYFLERSHSERTSTCLQECLRALESRARSNGNGVVWETPARDSRRIIEDARVNDPSLLRLLTSRPIVKPSLAHGIAGVLATLASVTIDREVRESTKALLRSGGEALCAEYGDYHGQSRFPLLIGIRLPQFQSGWCNGDLGVAAGLIAAGRACGSKSIEDVGWSAAEHESSKDLAEVEVFNQANPMLCHGHAGKALIFNRLFQLSDRRIFRDAAEQWYRHTLALYRPGQGVGGFVIREADKEPKNVRGLLMGSAGIGLSLMAGVSTVEPAWDRVLLGTALRPRPPRLDGEMPINEL